MIKIWVDDVRPAPKGYYWCKSVVNAKIAIENAEEAIDGAIETIRSYEDNYENISSIQKEHYKKHIKPIMTARIADNTIEVIDCDHDLGVYARFGGDGIRLLDWLEETGRNYPIRIHSVNPVGVANMRRIIERNGWTEVK